MLRYLVFSAFSFSQISCSLGRVQGPAVDEEIDTDTHRASSTLASLVSPVFKEMAQIMPPIPDLLQFMAANKITTSTCGVGFRGSLGKDGKLQGEMFLSANIGASSPVSMSPPMGRSAGGLEYVPPEISSAEKTQDESLWTSSTPAEPVPDCSHEFSDPLVRPRGKGNPLVSLGILGAILTVIVFFFFGW